MGSSECVRVSLIVINVIFLLGGLAILGLGIWVQIEKEDYVSISESDTGLTGSLLIIIIGAITAVISFVGFVGAVKRNRALLWIFFSVLAILIIIEIVAVILGMVYREKVEDELYEDMGKTVAEYETSGSEGITDAWDWAQQKFECCGVDNYTSWRRAIGFNKNGNHYLVPDSCCKVEKAGCGNFTQRRDLDEAIIYEKGCFNELKEFVKDHLLTIGLSALGFLVIELVIISLTVILVVGISKDSKVV